MKYTPIKDILSAPKVGDNYTVAGWVQSFRSNRFIALSDGSGSQTLQIVVPDGLLDEAALARVTFNSCISVSGKLVESQGAGQAVELSAEAIEVIGDLDPEVYPLQKKAQSVEFLREHAHLRMRTRTFSAVFRIRHSVSYAIHKFFNDNGFYYLHAPIITGSDAEGAGEMFRVTALDLENPPRTDDGKVDDALDFFGKRTNLTVSGQLQAEAGAMALGKVYTFGPTFRAENSNTSRHLAEFWMIEPEVAFNDLFDNMQLATDFVRYVISYVLENNAADVEFLNNSIIESEKNIAIEQRRGMSLIDTLKFVVENDFKRVTYTEAITILLESNYYKKGKFKYPVSWGIDLQSEHERWLVEKHFEQPIILYDYPRDIKAFYMRQNEDGKTVAAMDVLFPGIGEVIGGSQREERLDKLVERMKEVGISEHEMDWYLQLRRFGGCPHSGFGLGLERLILFITGMTNVRDVIPFPRTPGNAEF
jgi:asparaginyl-tRNA synthetase